jgi:hypothetical protein
LPLYKESLLRIQSISEGFHLQHALVLERKGTYFLFNKQDEKAAAPFFDRAIVGYYRAWGGLAKAYHLASEHTSGKLEMHSLMLASSCLADSPTE